VPHHDLDALDDDLIDQIFRTNWRGAFACVRAFRALLAAGDGGVVINMSSIAGTTGLGSNVAYAASKAALDSMTRSLARALAPQIRVVSVSPGLVEGKYSATFDPAWKTAHISRTPLDRLATGEDVADTVLAVAAYMPMTTGVIINVDGGRFLP
jgi:3-oxoacyl-[acyl-carrier protein] reductase